MPGLSNNLVFMLFSDPVSECIVNPLVVDVQAQEPNYVSSQSGRQGLTLFAWRCPLLIARGGFAGESRHCDAHGKWQMGEPDPLPFLGGALGGTPPPRRRMRRSSSVTPPSPKSPTRCRLALGLAPRGAVRSRVVPLRRPPPQRGRGLLPGPVLPGWELPNSPGTGSKSSGGASV